MSNNRQDALKTVTLRNAFYRDGYRAMLKVALVQGFVVAVLIGIIVAMALAANVKHVFFATNVDGRIMPIEPVNKNYFTRDQVVAWTARTAREVMQIDYLNYKRELNDAYAKFTQAGRVDFDKALRESRLIEAIEKNKLISSLTIDGAPQVLKEGLAKEGNYVWFLSMPITIVYDGQSPPQPFKGKLQMRVDRVNFLENPDGIAITQWVVGDDNILTKQAP